MKKAGILFLSFLLSASLTTPVLAEENTIPLDDVGMSIAFPEELENTSGYLLPYPIGPLDDMHHVYMMTFIYEGMPYEQAEEWMYSDDLTDEQKKELNSKQFLLTAAFATDSDFNAAVKAFDDYFEGVIVLEQDAAEEIGTADGFTFYAVPVQSDEYLARIDEEFAAEYKEIEQILLEAETEADLYAPIDLDKEMVGQKLEFTTTDIDGNTITSEELFAENEITMVNCWGLWCPHCVDEIGELAEIHERMQEKGCGILGLEFEQPATEETYQEAAAFLEENGVTYPNVVFPEEMLAQVGGFPVSYFVDKEGIILGMPLLGARVDAYESTLDNLLNEAAAAEADDTLDTAVNNAGAVYSVTVTDENGPVEDVAIQFCDDTTCSFEFTDADGMAFLESAAGSEYDVHVLKVPEGYQSDDTVYHFTDSSELNIQLQKES